MVVLYLSAALIFSCIDAISFSQGQCLLSLSYWFEKFGATIAEAELLKCLAKILFVKVQEYRLGK